MGGGDTNISDDDLSNTPLHYACAGGNEGMVRLLLLHGAKAYVLREFFSCCFASHAQTAQLYHKHTMYYTDKCMQCFGPDAYADGGDVVSRRLARNRRWGSIKLKFKCSKPCRYFEA